MANFKVLILIGCALSPFAFLVILEPTLSSFTTLLIDLIAATLSGIYIYRRNRSSYIFVLVHLINSLALFLIITVQIYETTLIGVLSLVVVTITIGMALLLSIFYSWKNSNSCFLLAIMSSVFLGYCLPTAQFLGDSLNDMVLLDQLDQFNNIVKRMQIGSKSNGNSPLPFGILDVRVLELSNRSECIAFLKSSGGRIHKGYMFVDNGHVQDVGSEFNLRHITANWYFFSDKG